MSLEISIEALQKTKCLDLVYGGYRRLVEVHLIGRDKNNAPVMFVWQVSGGSTTGEFAGWKVLKLIDVGNASITPIDSQAPRQGYSRQNNAIKIATHYL